jgi:iron complex transport system permease protein
MKRIAPFATVVALLLSVILSLQVGASQIDSFWSSLLHPAANEILWQIRIPRVLAAVIVGAALGVAGLLAQGACNNALAEPAILGTSAGASLGAVIGILTGLVTVGSLGAIACGAVGAIIATGITFKLASLRGSLSSFALIIVGIAVSALFTSLVGLFTAMVTRADARSISFWNFGSFALITQENLIGIVVTTVVGAAIAVKIAEALDRLTLGDSTAFHLGVDVYKTRWIALIALSILAGGAVSTVGTIGFIGLAGPHIARFIYGPSHRFLVGQAALIGALIVLLADTIARTVAQPNELPIGLITSLIGAPVLIGLVTIKNHVWKTQ